MLKYVVRRTMSAMFTLLCVLLFVFLAARLTGNPFEVMFPDGLEYGQLELLEEKYGLDKSYLEQFIIYLKNALQGDFGTSIIQSRSVTDIFFSRLNSTLKLGSCAFGISVVSGIFLGVIMAVHKDHVVSVVLDHVFAVLYAIPGFIIALLLMLLFCYQLRILPSQAGITWNHYVIPVFCLSVGPTISIARYVRSGIFDTISQDYIRTAISKGIGKRNVIIHHAFRNSLIPVLTQISMVVIDIICGSLVVEQIFSWPGIGSMLISSVLDRDFPTIQFTVLFIAAVVIGVNYILDILYMVVDPRVQTGGPEE